MDDNAKKEKSFTTISISKSSSERLTKFCKKYKIKKSEYIEISLDFFLKNAIDPTSHESPLSEITKLHKSVEHLKGFQRQFERENLIPILEKIQKSSIENIEKLSHQLLEQNQNSFANNSTFILYLFKRFNIGIDEKIYFEHYNKYVEHIKNIENAHKNSE